MVENKLKLRLYNLGVTDESTFDPGPFYKCNSIAIRFYK